MNKYEIICLIGTMGLVFCMGFFAQLLALWLVKRDKRKRQQKEFLQLVKMEDEKDSLMHILHPEYEDKK